MYFTNTKCCFPFIQFSLPSHSTYIEGFKHLSQLLDMYQFQAYMSFSINILTHVNECVDVTHWHILSSQDHITGVERTLACHNARMWQYFDGVLNKKPVRNI